MSTCLSHVSPWTTSLCMSDARYWEAVFPCDEEHKPALKKRRIDFDVEAVDKTNFTHSEEYNPQYWELQRSYASALRLQDILFAPIIDELKGKQFNFNDNDTLLKQTEPSSTWDDFFKYMVSQDPAIATESVTFTAPEASPEPRRDRRHSTHSNVVVMGTKIRYSCHLCTKTFPTNRGLKLHLHSHRTKLNTTSTSRVHPKSPQWKQINIEPFDRHVKKSFTCPLCDRGLGINQDRLVHLVSQACTRADRFLRRVTGGWECTTCDKVFDSRDQAERHTRTHESGRMIACPVCQEDFTGCKGNVIVKHVKERHPTYFDDIGC